VIARVVRARIAVSTAPLHDRRGPDRPAHGDRRACSECGNAARFEERYFVVRSGLSIREPAWVCGSCSREWFVRRLSRRSRGARAAGAANAPGRRPRGADLRELQRVLADIRARAQREGAADARGRAASIAGEIARGELVSVVAVDEATRIVAVNSAACVLIGVSRELLVNMPVRVFCAAPPRRFDRVWRRFVETGRFDGPCRLRQRSGALISVECVASANVVPGVHVGALASRRLLQSLH
jgi:PAS domain-containing protein